MEDKQKDITVPAQQSLEHKKISLKASNQKKYNNPNRRPMSVDIDGAFKHIRDMNKKALKLINKSL